MWLGATQFGSMVARFRKNTLFGRFARLETDDQIEMNLTSEMCLVCLDGSSSGDGAVI